MKLLLSSIAIFAVIYLLAMSLLYAFQRTLLFPDVDDVIGVDREIIVFTNNEVELHGWVLNQGKQQAIVYFGGNAEKISHNIDLFETGLSEYSIYLVDYRGYGKSESKPTEAGLFSDALFIYDQIKPKHTSISVIGRSLGSGVAVYLAAKRRIKKLVLLTPYDSIAEVAQSHYPFFPTRYLVRDKFESINYAQAINSPTLVIAAEFDSVVPNRHTEKLLTELANSDVVFQMVSNVTHGNIDESKEYRTALIDFFHTH
jgi:pimeloyl-ACP methyl ester carboxylesterase|tara:strand:+ start:706 stop:1476 length:771 start_codon:yes stop_codon:yes gene_type:complete